MNSNSGHILIVDDEPAMAKLIKEELAVHGFLCSTATEPTLARELIDGSSGNTQPFDLLIADVQMDGLELLAHVSKHSPECKVVLITGNSKRGYPDGLTGEESPLISRIIQVADCVDAMLMERTYKKGYPVEKMLFELTRCAGVQFDPKIAAATLAWCQSHREALFLPGKAASTLQEVA